MTSWRIRRRTQDTFNGASYKNERRFPGVEKVEIMEWWVILLFIKGGLTPSLVLHPCTPSPLLIPTPRPALKTISSASLADPACECAKLANLTARE